jgi:hypothetical protein
MAMSERCYAMPVMRGIGFHFEQHHRTEIGVVMQAVTKGDWHLAPRGSTHHTQTHMKLVLTNPSLHKVPILAAHRLCWTWKRKTQTFSGWSLG